MTDDAVVTVVVVTWNGAHLLPGCLDALARQEGLAPHGMRVVVVDNGSTDDSRALVRERYPWVELIASPTNRGFAGGNNLALRGLRTPFAVLVNNDAAPEPDAVAQLLEEAARPGNERVGALTATVLLDQRFRAAMAHEPAEVDSGEGRWIADPDGPVELVNSTGNVVRTDGYGVDRGWLTPRGEHFPDPAVFGFCGAAALLRREALDDVGLFDEDFFLYYEDTDLSWRLRLAGWDIRHCAGAVVRHQHAASSREGSALFRFHDDRNRLLTLTRNATVALALRAVLRYPVTTASMALRGGAGRPVLGARGRVMASYLRLLPQTMARRRAIGAAARVSRTDVERLLAPPPSTRSGAYRSAG